MNSSRRGPAYGFKIQALDVVSPSHVYIFILYVTCLMCVYYVCVISLWGIYCMYML